jgi:hypothetical protein
MPPRHDIALHDRQQQIGPMTYGWRSDGQARPSGGLFWPKRLNSRGFAGRDWDFLHNELLKTQFPLEFH